MFHKPLGNNESLWASWVMVAGDTRLYFSSDSGYDTHFEDIGDRLGSFDNAFLDNGQYDESWETVHLLPKRTIQVFKDLSAHQLFPVHWGMFELAFHTWYDPIVSLGALADAEDIELVTPLLGQVITLNETLSTSRWWEPLYPSPDYSRIHPILPERSRNS